MPHETPDKRVFPRALTGAIGIALLIFILGSISAWQTFVHLSAQQIAIAKLAFERDVADAEDRLTAELKTYTDLLYSLRGMIALAGTGITQDQFENFAQAVGYNQRFTGLLTINYAISVQAGKEAEFEKKTGLKIYPKTTNGYREVITASIPRFTNKLGLDIFASSRPQSSIYKKLRETGQITSSLRPYPLNDGGSFGLAARLGYYAHPSPAFNSDKAAAFMGSVGIGFNIETFFANALGPYFMSRFHILATRVEDDIPGKKEKDKIDNLIFDSGKSNNNFQPFNLSGDLFSQNLRIEFGQSAMDVKVSTRQDRYVGESSYWLTYVPALSIFLLSLLTAGYVIRARVRQIHLENVSHEKEAQYETEKIQREKMAREMIYALENERRQIGQELHDNLGQELTAARYFSEYVLQNGTSPATINDFAKISGILDSIAVRLRILARGLFSTAVDDVGFFPALKDLAANTEESYRIECAVAGDSIEPNDPDASINLYRITQEAISNAIQHGRASRITIEVAGEDDLRSLRIIDNGNGMHATAKDGPGIGLKTMSYRARLLGMKLNIFRNDLNGTTVEITREENEFA